MNKGEAYEAVADFLTKCSFTNTDDISVPCKDGYYQITTIFKVNNKEQSVHVKRVSMVGIISFVNPTTGCEVGFEIADGKKRSKFIDYLELIARNSLFYILALIFYILNLIGVM